MSELQRSYVEKGYKYPHHLIRAYKDFFENANVDPNQCTHTRPQYKQNIIIHIYIIIEESAYTFIDLKLYAKVTFV